MRGRVSPRVWPKARWRNWFPRAARLDPVYETVRRVRADLPPATTFLGFAGSPWTVATYMVAGQGSRDQSETRRMAYADPERFGLIIDAIIGLTIEYLSGQIEAGVDAVQLFDSWAGSLQPIAIRSLGDRTQCRASSRPCANAIRARR